MCEKFCTGRNDTLIIISHFLRHASFTREEKDLEATFVNIKDRTVKAIKAKYPKILPHQSKN